MIVDWQHHYVPLACAEAAGYRRGGHAQILHGGLSRTTLHDRLYDLDWQLREMDEGGIDVAVLTCQLGWDAPLDQARGINDGLAEAQARYPKRFVGLCHVPVEAGEAALREVDRAVDELGLRGINITSQIADQPLDRPEFRPFFRHAAERDLVVFIHPASLPAGYEFARDYDLARIVGREFDLALAVTRVIISGLLEELPTVKLVFGHFGGGIAAIKERIEAKSFRFGSLQRPFAESFRRLYFDMAGFEGGPAALACALTGIEPEQLVFATDYPQDFTDTMTATGRGVRGMAEYVARVRALGLPPATTEAVLGGTALRLLGLDAATHGSGSEAHGTTASPS
jgi:predicted TIM-barrel fold metal-dependent hydrolase